MSDNKDNKNKTKDSSILLSKEEIFPSLALSPRDMKSLPVVYKFYNEKHTKKDWIEKIKNDGFNIKNYDKLTK